MGLILCYLEKKKKWKEDLKGQYHVSAKALNHVKGNATSKTSTSKSEAMTGRKVTGGDL